MQKNVLKKLFISHKYDWILGAALALLALCLFFVFQKTESQGGEVQVKQGRDVVATYSLSEDGEYEYTTFYGTNTMVIENGEAYMTDSDCPDHLCENTGRISKVGETIICLPHELFITVISGGASDLDGMVK